LAVVDDELRVHGVAGLRVIDCAIMPAIVCGRCHYCRRGLGHLCVRFACTGARSFGLQLLADRRHHEIVGKALAEPRVRRLV